VIACAAAVNRLRRRRERLLALALAEIQLRRRRDGDLNDAAGQLPRHHLVEPDSIEARVVVPHILQDPLPDGGIKSGVVHHVIGASRRGGSRHRFGDGPALARGWRVGGDHGELSGLNGLTANVNQHASRRRRQSNRHDATAATATATSTE
jgi:hypothetical protein